MKAKTIIKNSKRDKSGRCPLYLRLSDKGRTLDISLGVRVQTENWDSSKEKCVALDDQSLSINRIVREFDDRFTEARSKYAKERKYLTLEAARDHIRLEHSKPLNVFEALAMYHEHIQARYPGIKRQGTLDKLRALNKHLRNFFIISQVSKKIACESLNVTHVDKFLRYLKSDLNLQHNSAMKHVRAIKTMLNYAVQVGRLESNPIKNYKLSNQPVRRHALDIYALRKLEGLDVADSGLRRTLDLFLFSCYTGISFSDIQDLRTDVVQTVMVPGEEKSLQMIIDKRKKTGVEYRAILIEESIQIIERYSEDADCIKADKLLPQMSNQVCNRRLKIMAGQAEIRVPLTFHIARYTCASILLMKDVSM
jgi:integrase/recombinase XerD